MLYALDYSLSPTMTNNLSSYSVLHLTNTNELISAFMNDDYTLSSEIYKLQLNEATEWLARKLHTAEHVYGGIQAEPPQALKEQENTVYIYFNTKPPLDDETKREIAVFYGEGLNQSYTRHWDAGGYNPWNDVEPPIYTPQEPELLVRYWDVDAGELPTPEFNMMDIGIKPSNNSVELSLIGGNNLVAKKPVTKEYMEQLAIDINQISVQPNRVDDKAELLGVIANVPEANDIFTVLNCNGIEDYTDGNGTVFYDATKSQLSGNVELTVIHHESHMDIDTTDYGILGGKPGVPPEDIDAMVNDQHVHPIGATTAMDVLGVDDQGNLVVSDADGNILDVFDGNDFELGDSTW